MEPCSPSRGARVKQREPQTEQEDHAVAWSWAPGTKVLPLRGSA